MILTVVCIYKKSCDHLLTMYMSYKVQFLTKTSK